MKKIIYSILNAVLLLSVISCEDILTEDPQSFLTPGAFPANEKDAIAATNAAYSGLYLNPREIYFGFVGTDEAFQGNHNQRPLTWYINLNEFNDDSNFFWQDDYRGIARCNAVIELVPEVDMDADLRSRLVGEAKFIRGFYYYNLVRKYGGIPIIDRVLSGPDELIGVKRNTIDEVYLLIKEDFTDAIDALPESYSGGEYGRATKWAAVGYLAKVHMTLGEWQQANDLLDQIISSGQFGLYADYEKLFHEVNEYQLFPDKDGNLVQEIIWEVIFKAVERGHTMTQQTGSRDVRLGGNTAHWGGFENMLPTPEFRALFDDYPTDLRLPISYVTQVTLPDGNLITLASSRTPGAGPISGKWHNPENETTPINAQSPNNVIVIRYADVLLRKAETENELNGPTNAYQHINLVRERAGIPEVPVGLSQSEMRDFIRDERSRELSFEGHRRYDLLRWGIFVETIRNTTSEFMVGPRNNIEDHHVLLPVPQNEIGASNGSIAQNPGYGSGE